MAIYFVLAVFIYLYGKLYRANSSNRRRKIYLIVTFGVLILVAGLRDPSVGTDLAGHYAKRYNMIGSYSWSQIPTFSATIGYEIGYCYFTRFLHFFSSDVQFFCFCYFFSNVCCIRIFYLQGVNRCCTKCRAHAIQLFLLSIYDNDETGVSDFYYIGCLYTVEWQ